MGGPEGALGLPISVVSSACVMAQEKPKEMCVGVSGVTVRTYCVHSAALVRKRSVVGRSCSVMAPCGLFTSPSAALGEARVKKLKGALAGGFCV